MSLRRPRQRFLALLLSLALIGLQCALPGSCAADDCGVATCCFDELATSAGCDKACHLDGERCADPACADCQSAHRGEDDSSHPEGLPPAPCDCGLPCCAGLSLAVPPSDSAGAPPSADFVRSREPPALVAVPLDPAPRPPRS